jgi:hypothetical protein
MIDTILNEINTWFNEANTNDNRLKLLSKLAILELCGWLEGEFDRLILNVESGRLNDSAWVESTLISKTYGFKYDSHWRFMFTRLVGEVFVRRVETTMESTYPGELERLTNLLRTLWDMRCKFAHADLNANIATMPIIQAPSWTISQYRQLKEFLSHYESVIATVLQNI